MRDDTTERLLLNWRAGNRRAGDRLLNRYVPELNGFFGRRSRADADDLVQRTLLACAQNLERFEGRSTFRSYLFGIARNQYLMHRRAEAEAGHEPVTLPTHPDESPSQLVAVRQEHVTLILALRQIEPKYSLVLRKYYWEEHSLEELALELDLPLGTVKSRLSRARAALKSALATSKLTDDARSDALHELLGWFERRAR